MSKLAFIFTNPVTLFIVLSALENVFIVGLYKLIRRNAPFSIWKLIGCIIFCIVLMTMTFRILFTSDYRKSEVNVSPIAELSSEQIDRLEDAIERFRQYDFITRFNIEEEKYTGSHLIKIFNLVWYREEPHSLLNISVSFYKEEQRAIDDFNFWISFSSRDKKKFTLITNDNNTEALLNDSKMIRTSDTLYIPDSKRYISSGIRLGSAYISLTERQENNNLDMNISTEFIKLLCDMLKDEE